MKYLVVILGGAAGLPVEGDDVSIQFMDKTALEAASTPLLDMFVSQGYSGLARTTPEGCEPTPEVTYTSILGFDPQNAGADTFLGKYGKRAAVSSSVDVFKGLAVLYGLDFLRIEGVTGDLDSDFVAQAQGCLDAFVMHDVVIMQIEAPDTEGHAGDIARKVAAIEAVDSHIMPRVFAYAKQSSEGLRVLVLPDHPTPVALKAHTAEPVPFVLWGTGVKQNDTPGHAFDEFEAARTDVFVDPASHLMSMLLSEGENEVFDEPVLEEDAK